MALRLMRLRMDGDLSALGGKHWQGYRFGADGLFYHPAWRRGFTPGELSAMFFRVQNADRNRRLVEKLQQQVDDLRAQLEKEKAHAWALEKLRGLSVPL